MREAQAPSELHPFSWERLAAAQCVLAGTLALVGTLAAAAGWGYAGWRAVLAAMIALAVCWLPQAISLLAMGLVRDPQNSVAAILITMLLRMGCPLVLALLVRQSGHWLWGAGLVPMVLVLYLISLVTETGLSLWMVGAFRAPAVKAS
jgi:hypothetical protein